MATKRHDGRRAGQLRAVRITPNFVGTAGGSCLIEMGGTRVICTASCESNLPPWRRELGVGWVTAEYGMLPASTGQRKSRPGAKGDSRATEIQRLIGRTLRNVVRLEKIGPVTLTLDCDVLEADGGTRTAAITGAYVALSLLARRAEAAGKFQRGAVHTAVAAVSVGIVDGSAMLDLDYREDSRAEVDMNVAMVRGGKFVEIQGSSEKRPFGAGELARLLTLARAGIRQLLTAQQRAIEEGLR
ncbi:MAG: ribonuclease PH [Planctomycetaceae bacterium]|nr:ribonuclease PH [Planctomycetaceae bacterium]